ncbi:hypothetical protein K502DRAFT_325554 [Neoconidiobolus thromboides FSU 785]|nr:hypothetical protein K502DRAFT_325554 [Neoconidiobolus thromboides FSU 785]
MSQTESNKRSWIGLNNCNLFNRKKTEVKEPSGVMGSRMSGDLAIPPKLPMRKKEKKSKREVLLDTWNTLPGYKKKTLTKKQAIKRIEFIKLYAQWLDRIPGQPIPIGIDGILGLIPGIGDVSAAGLSLLLIYLARDLNLPKSIYNKMFFNVGLDTTIGAAPIIGDLYDIWFKGNLRNLKLIEKWFEKNIELFEDDEIVDLGVLSE